MQPERPTLRTIPGGSREWVPDADVVQEFERAIVEALLFDAPSVVPVVSEILSPVDFIDPRLGSIFSASTALDVLSIPLLAEELSRRGELERVGGLEHLCGIADAASSAANVEAHARAVRRNALERRARELHERAARGETVDADLEDVGRKLEELDSHGDLEAVLLTNDRLRGLRDLEVCTSPLEDLFDCEPSLHLIQGRPKSGKTRLALYLAIAWSEGLAPWPGAPSLPGTRSLIVSAEQSAARIERNLRGLSIGVRGSRLERWTDRVAVAARAKSLPKAGEGLLTLDESGLRLLRGVLETARRDGRPFGLVVLDSLSRLKPHEADENSADDMTAVCAPLQALAEDQGVYLLLIHHRGHSIDSARSGAIGASRGSSAIAAVAQVAWTLDGIPGEPRQRAVRVAGNEVLDRELTFRVTSEDAEPGRVDYWRPIDPLEDLARRLPEFIDAGESISTSELAWRISGKRPEGGNDRPPGKASKEAARLRERWRREGRVDVQDHGPGIGHRISRAAEHPE